MRTLRDHGDDLERLGHISKETRSTITRMVILEQITRLEGEAAKRYAYVVARFEKYHVEGRRTIKSPSYEKAFGSDQELERRYRDDTIDIYEASAKHAKRDYDKLMKVLLPYGAQAKSMLDDLSCSDIEPPSHYRDNIGVILRQIARKFGVTEAPRSKRKGRR